MSFGGSWIEPPFNWLLLEWWNHRALAVACIVVALSTRVMLEFGQITESICGSVFGGCAEHMAA